METDGVISQGDTPFVLWEEASPEETLKQNVGSDIPRIKAGIYENKTRI